MSLGEVLCSFGSRLVMERLRQINEEQRRQMEKHKWIRSEEAGFDVGETGYYDWVNKHAANFREWVNTIPFECLGCKGDIDCEYKCLNECSLPFSKDRIQNLRKKRRAGNVRYNFLN